MKVTKKKTNGFEYTIFGIDLLWYAKGSLPLYTCVVAGLLSNQMMLDDRIIAKIKEFR